MNTKIIIQTIAALALVSASQTALAGKVGSRVAGLDALMQSNYEQAHAAIQADIRASIKATPLVFDEPGVTTGKVEIVAEVDPQSDDDATVAGTAAATRQSPEIRMDILNKALATPGLFGVYRYVTETAANAAVIIVK